MINHLYMSKKILFGVHILTIRFTLHQSMKPSSTKQQQQQQQQKTNRKLINQTRGLEQSVLGEIDGHFSVRFGLGQRLPSLVDASWNAEAIIKSCYVLLFGRLPSVVE